MNLEHLPFSAAYLDLECCQDKSSRNIQLEKVQENGETLDGDQVEEV